jgi:hypothetical protein
MSIRMWLRAAFITYLSFVFTFCPFLCYGDFGRWSSERSGLISSTTSIIDVKKQCSCCQWPQPSSPEKNNQNDSNENHCSCVCEGAILNSGNGISLDISNHYFSSVVFSLDNLRGITSQNLLMNSENNPNISIHFPNAISSREICALLDSMLC